MFASIFVGLSLFSNLLMASPPAQVQAHLLSSHEFSLEKRYPNEWVSDIFKDNILLNMAYMRGIVKNSNEINWEEVKKPFHYTLKLEPNQVFSFHDDVLPQYQGKVVKTAGAHFNWAEGFKSDGWLVGDGVCHLASIINWVARDANLEVVSPTNHDFMPIPEIPREFGVSIYNYPGKSSSNELQNLYIKNNQEKDVTFVFNYDGKNLKITASEENPNLASR